ncbi:zinc knuckle CX2CX4HX4C containing protein [Tanacetum coccineum]|uniref:Zinc knuckle CX2CX4HX4C containing protein n=1 Tax=Tanacetum coccineum TaxID=301880 RepID=A0ABQ5IA14_9ASTR
MKVSNQVKLCIVWRWWYSRCYDMFSVYVGYHCVGQSGVINVERFREMEAGFLLGNNAAKKGGLTSKVKPVGEEYKKSVGCVTKLVSDSCAMKPTLAATKTESVQHVNDKAAINTSPNDLRLVMDAANKSGVSDDSNASRSMQATPKKVQVSVLNNDVKVIRANVAIPIFVVEEMCDKFANTLYGYFVGERLAFPIIEAYVTNAWKKYGFERAIYRNGFFFFKFSSHDEMIKTLEGGPWFIRSSPIFLYKWSANTKLKKEAVTKVPVWVRIHNVPVVAFSKASLSLIATQLGRPIRLDSCTSDMCLNPWGHTSYARVLVEFNSKNEVMESIVVAIPLPKGEGHYLETLDVEYEWWPPREGGIRDTDGMHKKKGTNKAIKSTQGFRFSKPKTNLIYRLVSKPVTTKVHADKPNAKGSKNDIAYIQDDINLVQLRRNMDRLMDEDSVLELNSNNEKVSVIDTNSVPSANVVVSNNIFAPAEVEESDKGSLLEQFRKSREASTSKHISSMSDSDESEVEEVCMPDVIPGGGFLNGLEDDLERCDGYEARLYDLSEQEQAFCDQYDIRLNSHRRKF